MNISSLTSKVLSSMAKSKFDNITVAVAEENKVDGTNVTDLDNLSLDKQESIRFGQDTRHRKCLVYWMMAVVSVWLIIVLLLTTFNCTWCLKISEPILITLLATTTLNVLGLSKIILTGLFGHHNKRR